MKDILKIEGFFSFCGDGVALSEYGTECTKKILKRYTGGQIKEIAGVSRSALINYISGANQISKRGQDALKKLILRFNNEMQESGTEDSSFKNLQLFSDRDLLTELKHRGFNVFVSI